MVGGSRNVFSGEQIYAIGKSNSGTVLTANVTDIDFLETTDTHNSFNGTAFVSPISSLYDLVGQCNFTASVSAAIQAYIDGVADILLGTVEAAAAAIHFGGKVYLEKGQSLTLRSTAGATLNVSVNNHNIAISRVK